MIKIDVHSIDRLGITYEILAPLAEMKWDLGAVEMHLHHTFVTIRDVDVTLQDARDLLLKVEGVIEVNEISLLPTEFKQKQVRTLLSSLPNPIFRIDEHGMIEDMNTLAEDLWYNSDMDQDYKNFFEGLEGGLHKKDIYANPHQEINFLGKLYVAQFEPIYSEEPKTWDNGAIVLLNSMHQVGRHIAAVKGSLKGLVGSSVEMSNVKKQVHRIALSDFPILILGETGTGKELIARNCHEFSPRNSASFLAINCAALAENLLESELFGYAPGAFSGASKGGKPGLFELAEGGTVFLDEIGEMSPYLQAKMLRFLQDYEFRRVGGVHNLKANVRIITATHRNLVEMVENGEFREDLYYRINVLQIKIPALRNRKSDIPELVHHFIEKAVLQTNHTKPQITEKLIQRLMDFHWPGNVRQLENRIFRAIVMSEDNTLSEEVLFSLQNDSNTKKDAGGVNLEDIKSLDQAMQAHEHKILNTLWPLFPSTRKLGNRLGISHNSIALKLRKYEIK